MQARTLTDGIAEAITITFSVGKWILQPCPAERQAESTNQRTAQ